MVEEIRAYEHFAQFKFRIGDVVGHVADERVDNARYVVVERHLVETPGGIERRYKLTGVGVGSFIAREIEMRSAERPASPARED